MRGRASRTGAHCRERSRPPTPRGAVGPGARQSAARRLKSRDQSRTDPYALGGERSRCQRGPHRVGSGRKWLTVGLRPTVKSPRAKCWLAARTACCTDTAQIYLDVATTTRPSQTGFCGQGGHANLGFVAKEGTRVGPIPDSIPMHRLRRLRRSNGNVSNGASTASAPVTLKLLSQRSRRRRPGWLSAATPEAPGPSAVPGQAAVAPVAPPASEVRRS